MIRGYKSSIRKNLKKPEQNLHNIIAKQLDKQGIVEVLGAIYLEIFNLKKQLMIKGHIEPEAAYLMDEIYEHFKKEDDKKSTDGHVDL